MLSLLPFPVGSVVGVGEVEMAQDYRHVSKGVVLVAVEALLQRLPVLAVVQHDIGLSVAMGIVL